MNDPVFTVLLPVVRPPDLLRFAIRSVQSQVEERFELFIVCDGAPAETVAAARAFAAEDSRIRVFQFPKGERHGEEHRHTALQSARGRYVCQIADDDLWWPNHLVEMKALLQHHEFGGLTRVAVLPDGAVLMRTADIGHAHQQSAMQRLPYNIFGPTSAGYRLETYRRLPVGWSPAPPDVWSDLSMWRKFLALPNIKIGTRHSITSLHFSAQKRVGWTMARRQREVATYANLIATHEGRDELRQRGLKSVCDQFWALKTQDATLRGQLLAAQQRIAQLEAKLAERPEGA